MAITTDDFNKIWASTSPLTPYEFSESNYKEGWNFIGGTPPSRQMWDFLQKQNDEKSQYLLNNFDNYLPLSGGTMTGTIKVSGYLAGNTNNTSNVRIVGGTNASNGSVLDLYGKDHSSSAGRFTISANDGTNQKNFIGKPDGTLTWDNKEVERVNTVGSGYIRYENGLQICWGKLDVADTNVTLTFPVPFTVGYATCVPNIRDTFRISEGPFTTSCTIQTSHSSTVKVQWIAVGMWK